jgi:hypothetical protein
MKNSAFKILLVLLPLNIYSQQTSTGGFLNEDTITVAFWNVENLFDTFDHLEKDDREFLPDSPKE